MLSAKTVIQMPSKVLIANHCPDDQEMIRHMLSESGIITQTTNSGSSALEIIANDVFNLIICDYSLSDMDGLSVLESIKDTNPAQSVIMTNKVADLECAKSCIIKGADDYVIAPFDQNLSDKVNSLLCKDSKITPHNNTNNLDNTFRKHTDYRLQSLIGEGQMGAVYRSIYKDSSDSYVAIKILKGMMVTSDDLDILVRFYNEIDVLKKLDHPNIVKIIESGYAGPSMIPYYVMEYLKGDPLRLYCAGKIILQRYQKLALITQVADALSAVHAHKVFHRDLKPDNIIITTTTKKPTLIDFGIAKVPDFSLTEDDHILGTPHYLAPESFDSGSINAESDIFSLAVIMYELFLHKRPFGGENFIELGKNICMSTPVLPSQLDPEFPRKLETLMLKMLNKEPSLRPNAHRVASELRCMITELGVF